MVNLLDELFRGKEHYQPKFVIALDEAHVIAPHETDQYRSSMDLCRAIRSYSVMDRAANHAVWVVFASASSIVADFAVPQGYCGCGVSSGGQWEYPPYCHLGWDQRADVLEGTAATDVAQAGHIIGYGRPLWKSMQELHDVYSTIKVATSKLRGSSSENRKVPLVTLSRRFCLELTLGHPETNKFVASAMMSHLCVLLSMTDDRHWSFTTYPSEPFVSCVAATLIHSSDNLDRLLRALEEKIVSGMIIVDRSGGLASRLLWLFAKDLYVRCILPYKFILPAMNGKDWESELVDCRMIPVVDYFRFVFGKDFWAKVEGGRMLKRFSRTHISTSLIGCRWASISAAQRTVTNS
ncbi:hypothetical protein EDD16DRAFT_510956 [Pisolithus croceorrhizus]|nr:hypothetical protein EDD16DRAFT_510956 [Pisolithus croceorrhizus]KAI6102483.1 hypothetical protein EV401DRAFT_2079976 [Pisolithus croceorrhizus]